MKSIKWVYGYIRRYKIKFWSAMLLVLCCSGINMINPYITGKIVDYVIFDKKYNMLIYMLLIMITATVVKGAIRFIYQMTFEHISQDVIYEIRHDMFDKLQKIDVDYYNRTRTGDIMTRMTGDMEAIRHFIAWVMYNAIENGTVFLFAIITMMFINFKFALVMILITPFIAFCAYKMKSQLRLIFHAIREQFSMLNSVVEQNISGNRVVKAFAREKYEIKKFEKQNKLYHDYNMDLAKISQKYAPILNGLAGMFSVVMILVGGIFVINGSMSMGELVTFNSLIWALNNPMNMLGTLLNGLQNFIASSRKMIILQKEPIKIKNPPDGGLVVDRIRGEVEFKNVNFKYDYEPILTDISFKARPGQTIALFGQTGAGKSTIINLIERFYDVTSGEILIDGVNIKNYNLQCLRRNISISMQDVFLFSNTVEENICYGVNKYDKNKLTWAAEMADANGFIHELSDSYETVVGERGVGLSGGQKQRIALARSIIKDPSILILDDTTSSLDAETEVMIHNNLKSIYKNITTFVIAHRISSIKNADLILVIDNGKIVERGTHNELLMRHGKYYDVYNAQYGNYLNNDNLCVGGKING